MSPCNSIARKVLARSVKFTASGRRLVRSPFRARTNLTQQTYTNPEQMATKKANTEVPACEKSCVWCYFISLKKHASPASASTADQCPGRSGRCLCSSPRSRGCAPVRGGRASRPGLREFDGTAGEGEAAECHCSVILPAPDREVLPEPPSPIVLLP